jgi:hypothetical protein
LIVANVSMSRGPNASVMTGSAPSASSASWNVVGSAAPCSPREVVDHPLDRRGRLELAADAVQPGGQRGGVGQVRVRRPVPHADLQARGRPALARDAHERHAVVVAPAGPRRHERLGRDPPVGVHRRVEEHHHRRAVLEHPGDEVARDGRQALVARHVVAGVGALGVHERDVQVEARALVVVERLAHERRQQALAGGHLLDHVLEAERAVGRVQRVPWRRLISYCERPYSWASATAPRPRSTAASSIRDEQALRVGLLADGVDRRVLLGVGLVATRGGRVGLAEVELELGPEDRRQPEVGVLREHALERPARIERGRLARVGVGEVDDARGDLGLPRDPRERRQVGDGDEVGEAALEARPRRCGAGRRS